MPQISLDLPVNPGEKRKKIKSLIGLEGSFTASNILDATADISQTASEVETNLNSKKARLAQLNDGVEQAKADLEQAREDLKDAERNNSGVDAAEQAVWDAKRALEDKKDTFNERASVLRDLIEDLKAKYVRATIREEAQAAQDLNDQIEAKAEDLKAQLGNLKALNTELADLQEQASKKHLDAGIDALRVLGRTGRKSALENPAVSFSPLDNDGDRYHQVPQTTDINQFLTKLSQ